MTFTSYEDCRKGHFLSASDIPNKFNGDSSVRLIHKINDLDCKKKVKICFKFKKVKVTYRLAFGFWILVMNCFKYQDLFVNFCIPFVTAIFWLSVWFITFIIIK